MNPAFLGSTRNRPITGGGGGGGTYSHLAHAAAGVNGTSTATTSGIDTSSAKLIVIAVLWFTGTPTVSDSKGNTWTALTTVASGSSGGTQYFARLYYCINPTVGTGHTFSATANFTVIDVRAFSCTATPVFDVEATGAGSTSAATFQPSTITPAGTELFVTGLCFLSDSTLASINSSFNKPDTEVRSGSGSLFGITAYKMSSSAESPTWTVASGNTGAAAMAAWK